MVESIGADIGTRILQVVEDLGRRMDRLETRMGSVETELAALCFQMQLRGDPHKVRTELQAELQRLRTEKDEELRRLDSRLKLTDSVVILVAGELRRPRDISEQLQSCLRKLEAR